MCIPLATICISASEHFTLSHGCRVPCGRVVAAVGSPCARDVGTFVGCICLSMLFVSATAPANTQHNPSQLRGPPRVRGNVFPFVVQVAVGAHQYARHMIISNVLGGSNNFVLLTLEVAMPHVIVFSQGLTCFGQFMRTPSPPIISTFPSFRLSKPVGRQFGAQPSEFQSNPNDLRNAVGYPKSFVVKLQPDVATLRLGGDIAQPQGVKFYLHCCITTRHVQFFHTNNRTEL